ncbi:hypothetical protein GGR55DRAFT_673631 [Xylaria sp. FL0064]|nr:hypothetical protein GGR55DRAFT_673631 [Xylaria sp. FL0064]
MPAASSPDWKGKGKAVSPNEESISEGYIPEPGIYQDSFAPCCEPDSYKLGGVGGSIVSWPESSGFRGYGSGGGPSTRQPPSNRELPGWDWLLRFDPYLSCLHRGLQDAGIKIPEPDENTMGELGCDLDSVRVMYLPGFRSLNTSGYPETHSDYVDNSDFYGGFFEDAEDWDRETLYGESSLVSSELKTYEYPDNFWNTAPSTIVEERDDLMGAGRAIIPGSLEDYDAFRGAAPPPYGLPTISERIIEETRMEDREAKKKAVAYTSAEDCHLPSRPPKQSRWRHAALKIKSTISRLFGHQRSK